MCFELKSTSSWQKKDDEGTFAHSVDQEVPCAVIITGSGSAVQQTFPEAVDTPAPPSTVARATGAAQPLECSCCEGGTNSSSLHFILTNLYLNTPSRVTGYYIRQHSRVFTGCEQKAFL